MLQTLQPRLRELCVIYQESSGVPKGGGGMEAQTPHFSKTILVLMQLQNTVPLTMGNLNEILKNIPERAFLCIFQCGVRDPQKFLALRP